MNSGSSAFISSGGQSSADDLATSSWYQTSRPGASRPAAGAAHDQHVLDDARAGALDGGVGVVLQRDRLAAAQALVGGDDEGRTWQSSMRPASESGEKPPKTTEWIAPMPRAGEHRIGRLRDHRHVDRDPVALLDAVASSARWRAGRHARKARYR